MLPRFYPIVDTSVASSRNVNILAAVDILIAAGAGIIQLRHKGFYDRGTFAVAEGISKACSAAGVPFVINDRADIAALVGAHLHVGQDDLAPSLVRGMLPQESRIGYSTHNEAQLRAAAAQPADYVALGPIFGTASKLNPDPIVGVDELRRLRHLTARPLVAIGGITRNNAHSVWAAGADSVAVIADLFPQVWSESEFKNRAEEWIELSRN